VNAIKELEGIIEWLNQVALVVKDFEMVLEWKRDWKFVSRLRDQLKSLRTLRGVLDGVSCTGAMREVLGDLLAEVVKGIESKLTESGL